jgi:exodeoxyribonuclease VII large subunit
MSVLPQPSQIFRLRTVTARVKALLHEASTKRFWVQAQLIAPNHERRDGHFYCQLVEVDERGRQVARMSAVIWKSEYTDILCRLEQAGHPGGLAASKEICALCSIRFHDVYGLQLQIYDVDPYGGEAHIERNRRLILEKLKSEGILEQNQKTFLPAASLRIGLITSKGSAAYNDFCHTIRSSAYSFKIVLASCLMQGEETGQQVVAAIQNLQSLGLDAICIVRGGGSPLDLAWFDNERIARAIIDCPIPVWVGIGHEIDVGVLDFAAHKSHKTPTAVAEALVGRVRELDGRLEIVLDRLKDLVERQLALATKELTRNREGLLQGSRKYLDRQTLSLERHVVQVESAFDKKFGERDAKLKSATVRFLEKSKTYLESRRVRLVNSQARLPTATNRRLEAAAETMLRKIEGLVQGSRKHLDFHASQLLLQVANVRRVLNQVTQGRQAWLREKQSVIPRSVEQYLKAAQQRLGTATRSVASGGSQSLALKKGSLRSMVARFQPRRYDRLINKAIDVLVEKNKRLEALRPENLLLRGYSVTRDATGRIIRSIKGLSIGDAAVTEVADGFLDSVIGGKKGKTNGPRQ